MVGYRDVMINGIKSFLDVQKYDTIKQQTEAF